jgi:hypothetical protein
MLEEKNKLKTIVYENLGTISDCGFFGTSN